MTSYCVICGLNPVSHQGAKCQDCQRRERISSYPGELLKKDDCKHNKGERRDNVYRREHKQEHEREGV